MRKIALYILFVFLCKGRAQTLFTERFGTLALTSYTTGSSVSQYTLAPANFQLIEDNNANNIGTQNNYNVPFQIPALKNSGWVVAYNSNVNDTFLVSTSWFDNNALSADRWIITPTVNVGPNTVITWMAMSPDPSSPDGYEVYGTNKTGTLTSGDFTLGDKLFSVADGNTSGGGERSTWTRRSVYLGLFQGQTLRFAFRNNSKNMYQLWIDDIEVINQAKSRDAQVSGIMAKKYFLINTPQTLIAEVKNTGAVNINTVVLNYKYGNSSVNTQTFVLTNSLTAFQTQTFAFPQTFNFTSAGLNDLQVWLSAVNGTVDEDNTNDTLKMSISALASAPTKSVLVEQFVSAYDGESPDAQERGASLQNAGAVVVNIHDNDLLEVAEAGTLINNYKKTSSTALIDRVYFPDLKASAVKRTQYYDKFISQGVQSSPVKVSVANVNYFPGTNALSFQVNAEFFGAVKGDLRLGAYLVENNVYGSKTDTTVNGYNQLSNYYNVPWSPYYQLGYFSVPMNAHVLDPWRFKHQNVLVHLFDGSDGAAGVIPLSGVTTGQIFSKSYLYTVVTPTGISKFNPDNLYIVAFVAEYDADLKKKDVLNVTKVKVTSGAEVIGVTERSVRSNIQIYPNPVCDEVHIDLGNYKGIVGIEIRDALGKMILKTNYNNKDEGKLLDVRGLEEGLYFLTIEQGLEKSTLKLIKQKSD